MLNQQQTKIQFESLETLQAIQKQAYQMLNARADHNWFLNVWVGISWTTRKSYC